MPNKEFETRQRMISLLAQILSKYEFLMNSYNLDYFVEDHWNTNLPRTWQESLKNFDKLDIPALLSPQQTTKYVYPLTLLCLRQFSTMIRKFRKIVDDERLPQELIDNHPETSLTLSFKNGSHARPEKVSDHILCRKVKLKKRHEIEQLCKVIPSLMKLSDLKHIIDCGSGQGHLDRFLSFIFGYNVHSIEMDGDNLESARQHDILALDYLRRLKLTEMDNDILPKKVNCFLQSHRHIDESIQTESGQAIGKHLLLGLHACGPLSNMILEEFASNPNTRAMVLVCCCYMKNGK